MSWEKTVMNRKERVAAARYDSMSDDLPDWARRVLEAQAKISYEAGVREEREKWVSSGNELLKEYPEASAFWLKLVSKLIYQDIK